MHVKSLIKVESKKKGKKKKENCSYKKEEGRRGEKKSKGK